MVPRITVTEAFVQVSPRGLVAIKRRLVMLEPRLLSNLRASELELVNGAR